MRKECRSLVALHRQMNCNSKGKLMSCCDCSFTRAQLGWQEALSPPLTPSEDVPGHAQHMLWAVLLLQLCVLTFVLRKQLVITCRECTGRRACQDVCYLVCKAAPFPADHAGRTGLPRQCLALNDFPLMVLISYYCLSLSWKCFSSVSEAADFP